MTAQYPCQYIDADFRLCQAEAVIDVGAWGRGKLPRCRQHKRVSPRQVADTLSRYRFRRACMRGVVSQAEMLHRLDAEMENGLDRWEYRDGREVVRALTR